VTDACETYVELRNRRRDPIKPAWDRLGDDYKASDSVMIVDVDCDFGKATCSKMGVQGYPTIMYFTAGNKKGEYYFGGRDYDRLKSFVSKTLDNPVCDGVMTKNCAENEGGFLTKMDGKTNDSDPPYPGKGIPPGTSKFVTELNIINSEMKAAAKECNSKMQAVLNKVNQLVDELIKAPEAKAEL
jgi:hypothetical protein